MKNRTKYLALISTTLLVAVFAGPANAAVPTDDTPTAVVTPLTNSISVDNSASISFEKPAIETTAAPEVVVAPQAAVVETRVPVQAAPVAAAPVSAPVTQAAPVQAAPVAPAPISGNASSIAAAAYAQLGVAQDCTMLVTNSIRAVGINFHGWPAGYLGLGRTVSAAEALPGDLTYYANGGMGLAHIAVYVGNGQAIHGGWNGGTTALASVNVGSGPVFIRVA